MSLFLSLYLGHILGDFVLQPGKLVVAKRTRFAGVVLHTAIVLASTAAAGAAALPRTWPAVLLAGVAHFGVEHLSVRARRVSGASNLSVFLLDQGIHIVSLALIALCCGREAGPPVLGLWPSTLDTLALVCGVATVAFMGSILVFEIEVSDSAASLEGEPLLGMDVPRIYGMLERGAALTGALLLPVPALGILAFAPRLVYAFFATPARRKHHLVAAVAGFGLCLVVWALAQAVIAL